MIVARWHVVYERGTKREETCVVITGKTFGELCPAYVERLSTLGRILVSELLGYEGKEEEKELAHVSSTEGKNITG